MFSLIESISKMKDSSSAKGDQFINIILAEDDLDDVFVFKMALNELNITFRLNHADNGERLLILLKELLPDIIFLDLSMPGKDGISCLMEIRKNTQFDCVPVVLISGSSFKRHIDEAFTNRANFYVVKANSINEMVEYLKVIFSVDWKNTVYYPPINQFVIGNT